MAAKTVILKQEIDGAVHTLYPQTIPSQVVDPDTGRSLAELASLDHTIYEVVESLPQANIQEGKLYLVQTSTPGTYTQYVWNGYSWRNLGNAAINLVVEDTLDSGSVDKGLSANQGRELKYMLTGEKKISVDGDWEHYKDGYELMATSAQLGLSLDNVPTYSAANFKNIRIPLQGYRSVRIKSFVSSSGYGHLVVDSEDNVIAAYSAASSGDAQNIAIPVTENAAYLIYSYIDGNANYATLTLYGDSVIPQNDNGDSYLFSGTRLLFAQGSPLEDGSLNTSANYITSEPIFGPHLLILNDGYVWSSASLYDRNGNIASWHYIYDVVSWAPNRGATNYFYCTGKHHPDYGYRYVIKHSDGSPILPTENVVNKLVMLEDSGLHRWIPNDLPKYDIALQRLAVVQRLAWIPRRKAFQANATINQYYHRAGNVFFGPPYSDCANIQKYVPNDVSVRTFLSAAANKRSILYTEDMAANISKYGISYTCYNARSVYGAVCSSFTAWVMGNPIVRISSDYKDLEIDGLTRIDDPTLGTINTVRPLDLLWSEGHVMMISAVWRDEFENTQLIELSEMSTYPFVSLYTPEQFIARYNYNSMRLLRYSGWNDISAPDDITKSLVPIEKWDAIQRPVWNPDIMTFAGDYATFKTDDVIVLNARRAGTYTKVNLYKDGSTTPTEIDITGLSEDGIIDDGEDWVKVVLTNTLTAGKYEARLSDGTDETAGTFFEVLGISISATYVTRSLSITFSANGGTPLYITDANSNGFSKNEHVLTAEEVAGGSATLAWARVGEYPRLKFVVQGEYGTATTFITFPTA
jgi:hypothetical protein